MKCLFCSFFVEWLSIAVEQEKLRFSIPIQVVNIPQSKALDRRTNLVRCDSLVTKILVKLDHGWYPYYHDGLLNNCCFDAVRAPQKEFVEVAILTLIIVVFSLSSYNLIPCILCITQLCEYSSLPGSPTAHAGDFDIIINARSKVS